MLHDLFQGNFHHVFGQMKNLTGQGMQRNAEVGLFTSSSNFD